MKLREVVEVAKTFEATTFANQLLKTARNTQQEQVNYTTKSHSRHSVFGVAGIINSPVINIALQWGKNVENVVWPLRARMYAGLEHDDKLDMQQQSNFVSEDTEEDTFVTECDTTPRFARKYFSNLHLKHGEKTKVVRAQIDSASTCNTIPNALLRKLFSDAEIR